MKNHMVTVIQGNGFPLIARSQNRNDLCACGSGKKAKKCHGTDAQYFKSKLTDDEKRLNELKAQYEGEADPEVKEQIKKDIQQLEFNMRYPETKD